MSNNLLGASTLLGYPLDALNASATRGLNAAATWQAFSFVGQGKTLSELQIWQATKTGTPVAADITCSLCAANPFSPNATPLEVEVASSIPAIAGILAFPGFTTVLTAGQMYWGVIKNLNATPASNFVTINYGSAVILPAGAHGSNAVATSNSGTAWATNLIARTSAMLIKYSDGTTDGLPHRSVTRADSGGQIFGTRSRGVKFHGLISGLTYNIASASFIVSRLGTPSALRCRIYNNVGTLLGTSVSVLVDYISTATAGAMVQFEFASPIACPGSDAPYRIVLDQVGAGGNSSNCYRFGFVSAFNTTSEVLALGPMAGTWCHTNTLDNTAGPVVWTDVADEWVPCTIALDSDTPYTVSSGGGYPFVGSRIGGVL